jgi:two-component system CheB/CheR fusion protein
MNVSVPAAGPNGGNPVLLPQAETVGPPDRHNVKGLRVLIVDDDVGTREAVADVLKEMGATVEVAGSTAEAMGVVGKFHPQVLLCDVAMPGEDGYAFIRRLRSLGADGAGGTPALALTALATEDDRRRSLAAGFQLHLTKPVDIRRLSEAVVELANTHN